MAIWIRTGVEMKRSKKGKEVFESLRKRIRAIEGISKIKMAAMNGAFLVEVDGGKLTKKIEKAVAAAEPSFTIYER